MKQLLFIVLFLSASLFAQSDWQRWEKKSVEYQIHQAEHSQIVSTESPSFLSFMKQGYSFLISDLDGDNCPFYPTCSAFFVQSVNRTNFITGVLMFADRFTRDSNLFKSKTHYPRYINGKLYDPVENYLLIESKIIPKFQKGKGND